MHGQLTLSKYSNFPHVVLCPPAYLETGDYNVIALDWSQLCPSPWYQVAVTNSVDAGKYLGSFIDLLVGRKMTRLQDVHIIGHSLGAHVAGIAGASVQSGKVGRVTGLDPAYPLFSKRTVKERLDASDATLVDTIHTCGKFLGIFEPQGHIDFYPNRGLSAQPGCGVDMFGVCSHSRAHEFFTESIRKKYMFVATRCHTIEEMMDKHCTGSKGRMGEDISDILSCKRQERLAVILNVRALIFPSVLCPRAVTNMDAVVEQADARYSSDFR
uniref:Lipase domain-containing protein n=1 Tax=Timema bartmani TaxID=61472 RepID=A0A7R9HY65_9NEOP|nr:unnamed protein product [Timema bartmani]